MFLVDNDQFEVYDRRENTASRSYHNSCFSASDIIPLNITLPVCESAVKDCYTVSQTTDDPINRLRSKRYLGTR